MVSSIASTPWAHNLTIPHTQRRGSSSNGNVTSPSPNSHRAASTLKTSERTACISRPASLTRRRRRAPHDEVGERVTHARRQVLVVLEHDQVAPARPAPPAVLAEADGKHRMLDDAHLGQRALELE